MHDLEVAKQLTIRFYVVTVTVAGIVAGIVATGPLHRGGGAGGRELVAVVHHLARVVT